MNDDMPLFERTVDKVVTDNIKVIEGLNKRIAELEKECDELSILSDLKNYDIDTCLSVLGDIYGSGANIGELEEDVRHILVNHTFASSTDGKVLQAHNLEQRTEALEAVCDYAVQINKPNSEWEDFVSVKKIKSVAVDLRNQAKALKEGE